MKTDFSYPTILLVSEQPRPTSTGTVQLCQFDQTTWMRARMTADDGERNISKAAQAKPKDPFRCRTGKEVTITGDSQQAHCSP